MLLFYYFSMTYCLLCSTFMFNCDQNVIIIFSFATGCDVSSDGEKISCDCREGYFGGKCQSCAAGYYGRPEVPGRNDLICLYT